MNLNTIVEVKRPKSFEDIEWRDGHAFLEAEPGCSPNPR